ncbi:MAG: alanyl-tRNA editing protein, partial [Atribacterota bacterium]|nr:alanyl-tRNA editing protein [Atribacterota bacterium]
MTKKLYHLDSYQTEFKAVILEKKLENNRTYLILDHTYFYPEAGGQLCDKGFIEGIPVIDVQERNGEILHFLKEEIDSNPGSTVKGEIDWEIRFDHMQQHTGQHLLSAVLLDLWNLDTLSFHMSEDVCTIDINDTEIDEAKLKCLEKKVNSIIYANKPILNYYLEDQKENSGSINIRKIASLQEKMRIIEIENVDKNACGGTHCKATGEIGVIKIINWEHRKEKLRLYFLCGKRALLDYQQKHQITKQLANFFTTGIDQLIKKI